MNSGYTLADFRPGYNWLLITIKTPSSPFFVFILSLVLFSVVFFFNILNILNSIYSAAASSASKILLLKYIISLKHNRCRLQLQAPECMLCFQEKTEVYIALGGLCK